jgi:hypothetical protein
VNLQERVNALVAATAAAGPLEQLMVLEPILECEPHGTANPGLSETYLAVFESRREAIFKPFNGKTT